MHLIQLGCTLKVIFRSLLSNKILEQTFQNRKPRIAMTQKNIQIPKKNNRRGIQSIETGFRILDTLRTANRPLQLKEIAEQSKTSVANTHYYLVSFQNVGIVHQDQDSSLYSLGPYALSLGLAALEQFDIFSVAKPLMQALVSEIEHTVFLGVWGNKGPTIVYRVEGGLSQALLGLKIGSVLPLLSSALGRNFLAHLPEARTKALVEEETKNRANNVITGLYRDYSTQDIEEIRNDVLQYKISRCRDALLPNFSALSAPIFDMSGEMIAGLTVMGMSNVLNDDLQGPISKMIIAKANEISYKAGWAGDKKLD